MVGKVCNVYGGFIYLKNFKASPFKKVIENLFGPKLNSEEEANDLMLDLIKFCMNSIFGQSIKKDVDEEYIIRSKN